MLPACNKGPGLSFGFPDVCLTPVGPVVVPIPYPNFGAHAMAATFSPVVSVAMMPALNMASVIAMTTGDEPGVAHWTIKGPGTFDTGNPVVFIDMLPGINQTCQADGNTSNNEPSLVVAPGAPHVLYTYTPPASGAPEPWGRALDREEAEAFTGALEGPATEGEGRFVDDDVAYLKVRVFSLELPSLVWSAVERLRAGGMRALILDLRGCPGGELRAMLELAGDFLPRGSVLARVEDQDGDVVEHRVRKDDPYVFPLVVLVDEGTASAAALFAGCMQAHGRAALVGAPTHPKDTGQILVPGPGGTAAVVTVARVSAPHGGGGSVDPEIAALEEDALTEALRIARAAGA